ncbi:MAG: hypothetical protein WAV13_12250 [Thermodesulfovibrionales bacterium]
MHNCKDEDTRRINAIEHTKWKPVDKTATNIIFHDRPGIWVGGNALHGFEYFNGEVVAKTSFALLIVIDSCEKLFFGVGVK